MAKQNDEKTKRRPRIAYAKIGDASWQAMLVGGRSRAVLMLGDVRPTSVAALDALNEQLLALRTESIRGAYCPQAKLFEPGEGKE